ncbi:MAG: spore coat protein U domain-containing protein [Alphaproteobacteria bacterium]|nr:spore coat protein U domain-containing protein [Alphaproteobacteria bacterium]
MSLKKYLAFIVVLIAGASSAFGQSCNFTMTGINFGSVNLGVAGAPTTSGTFSATCTGAPNSTITICPNIGDGTGSSLAGNPRYLVNGARNVSYNLYQPSGAIWGSFVWPYAPRAPLLSLTLNAAGSGSLSQTINAQLTSIVALAPAGVYSSVYSGSHTLIDYGYAPGQSCASVSARATRAPFTVTANNNNSCNISTTPMSFGTNANLTTTKTSSNQISVTCTNGVRYTLGLGYGANGGTSPTNRFMVNPGNGQKIIYGIYQNSSMTLPWGITSGSDVVSGTATGLTQSYTAYGQIPVQATPNGGAYSDTVVITLTY